MNDQDQKILGEMEKMLQVTNRHEPSMQQILRNADAGDLDHQKETFINLLTLEGLSVADKLRHRADMMRRRADEFDQMADSLSRSCDEACHTARGVVTSVETILDILQEHAHIEPTKV